MSRTRLARWLAAVLSLRAAGAAAQGDPGSPAAPPAPTATPSPPASVRLLSADPQARLRYAIEVDANRRPLPAGPAAQRRSAAHPGHFEPLCIAPCEVKLPPGSYALGLAEEGEQNVPAAKPLLVDRDTTVIGQYHANGWRRWLGVAVLATAVIVSGGIFLNAPGASCAVDGPCNDPSSTPVAVGAGVLAVGIFSGILLIATGSNSASFVER